MTVYLRYSINVRGLTLWSLVLFILDYICTVQRAWIYNLHSERKWFHADCIIENVKYFYMFQYNCNNAIVPKDILSSKENLFLFDDLNPNDTFSKWSFDIMCAFCFWYSILWINVMLCLWKIRYRPFLYWQEHFFSKCSNRFQCNFLLFSTGNILPCP